MSNELNGQDTQEECIENMIAEVKITPRNFPVPVSDLVFMATMNKSVFISGQPHLHTTQTTASLKRLSAGLDV